MINSMLIKKFLNITVIFNKIMFIKMMKLCLKLTMIIKEVLYVVKCLQVITIINDICINILLDSDF